MASNKGNVGHGTNNKFRKLTVRELLEFYNACIRDNSYFHDRKSFETFVICHSIVKHYLGDRWIEKNLSPETGRGFMRLLVDGSPEAEKKSARMWDLGELLINLQDVNGFERLIERMKTEESESSLAELHVGRILYVNEVNFRFVEASGLPDGDNFDLEITYADGTVVCGETKCKTETTQISKDTIKLALKKARGQLPPDKPGIIFIKFPQTWFEGGQQPSAERMMIYTAAEFFSEPHRNTRVVSAVFYGEPFSWDKGIIKQGHYYKEVPNLMNKFDTDRDWSLLHYKPPDTDHWNKLPEKWIRLVNFPDELGKHGKV